MCPSVNGLHDPSCTSNRRTDRRTTRGCVVCGWYLAMLLVIGGASAGCLNLEYGELFIENHAPHAVDALYVHAPWQPELASLDRIRGVDDGKLHPLDRLGILLECRNYDVRVIDEYQRSFELTGVDPCAGMDPSVLVFTGSHLRRCVSQKTGP